MGRVVVRRGEAVLATSNVDCQLKGSGLRAAGSGLERRLVVAGERRNIESVPRSVGVAISRIEASFRHRVASGEALVGTFLNTGSPIAAEISSLAGFDWVVLDLEHGSGTETDLLSQLHALKQTATASIVRVESSARLRIGRALDLGASGVMVPGVETIEQARDGVGFLRYPPAGTRGVALMTRGNLFGSVAHDELAEINETVTGVFQIESARAVDNVGGIAALDGVDVLLVGPSDLSHSLGIPGEFEHPDFEAAISRVAQAGRQSGKALGMLVRLPDEVPRYFDLGYRFIGVSSDSSMLISAMASTVRSVRAQVTAN